MGYGLYFAPRARKSVGYTSLRGSYWAGGHSNYGFMALYEVVYGKPYDVSDNAGLSDMNYEKLQKRPPAAAACTPMRDGRCGTMRSSYIGRIKRRSSIWSS